MGHAVILEPELDRALQSLDTLRNTLTISANA